MPANPPIMDVGRPEGGMSIGIDGDAVPRALRNASPFWGTYPAFATELIIVDRVGLLSSTQDGSRQIGEHWATFEG